MQREFEKHAQLECGGNVLSYVDDYCQIVKEGEVLKVAIKREYLAESPDPQKTVIGVIKLVKELKTL